MTRWPVALLVSCLGLSDSFVCAGSAGILGLPSLPPLSKLADPPESVLGPVLPSPLWWLGTVPFTQSVLYSLPNITPTVSYTVQMVPRGTSVPSLRTVRSLEQYDLLLERELGRRAYRTRCAVYVGYRFDAARDRLPEGTRQLPMAERRFMASSWVFVSVQSRDLKQNLVGNKMYSAEVDAVLKSLNLIKDAHPHPPPRRPRRPLAPAITTD